MMGDNFQFGFADIDADSAKNTVDKLNGYKFMGRKLKANISSEYTQGEKLAPMKDRFVQLLVSFVTDLTIAAFGQVRYYSCFDCIEICDNSSFVIE